MLASPTVLAYLFLGESLWIGTREVVDSAGLSHTVRRASTANFAGGFFLAEYVAIQMLIMHMWHTLGEIAQRYQLADRTEIEGRTSIQRLEAAATEASRLSRAEQMHCALLVCDWIFSNYIAFPAAYGRADTTSMSAVFGRLLSTMCGGPLIILVCARVLVPARVSVLRSRRGASEAYAWSTEGWLFKIVLLQFAVFVWCAPVCNVTRVPAMACICIKSCSIVLQADSFKFTHSKEEPVCTKSKTLTCVL